MCCHLGVKYGTTHIRIDKLWVLYENETGWAGAATWGSNTELPTSEKTSYGYCVEIKQGVQVLPPGGPI